MTTVVDALTDATAELHNAALLFQNRADQVATQLASFQTSAQTTINNYLNRAPSAGAWVDGNNGVDGPGAGTEGNPFKTLDYALDHIDSSVQNTIYLLTDVVLLRWHSLFSKVNLVGFARIPSGPYGFPYTYTNRKIFFAPEAANSPRTDFGRVPAFFDLQGPQLIFTYIDVALPALSAAVLSNSFPYLLAVGGNHVTFINSTISAEASSGCAKLFSPPSTFVYAFFNTVTIANNAKGQIFPGVAAGQDPNIVTNGTVITNIKSA